ncbi:MAG: O-antigen ligase family protein [Betaproteobacteria bacterium]
MEKPSKLVTAGCVVACFAAPFGTTSVGLLIVLAGLLGTLVRQRPSLSFSHRVYWLFLALLASMVISALVSPVRVVALALTLAFALVVTGFVFGTQWTGLDQRFVQHRLIPALVVGSVVSYLYAIIHFLVVHPLRAEGLFAGSPGLGTLVILCTGVSLGYFADIRGRWRWIVTGAYLLLAIATLLLTFARGAWFGFLVMLTVFALVNRGSRRWALVALLGTAVTLATIPALRTRFLSSFQVAYSADRVNIWLATLKMIKDYPVFGVGAGVFPNVFPHYALPQAHYKQVAFAHNLFLQVMAEFGAVGTAVFIAMLVSALFMSWRLARTGGGAYQGVFAALVGVLIHQQVDIPIWGLEIGGAFWLLIGLVIARYAQAGGGVQPEGAHKL